MLLCQKLQYLKKVFSVFRSFTVRQHESTDIKACSPDAFPYRISIQSVHRVVSDHRSFPGCRRILPDILPCFFQQAAVHDDGIGRRSVNVNHFHKMFVSLHTKRAALVFTVQLRSILWSVLNTIHIYSVYVHCKYLLLFLAKKQK